MRHAIMAAVAAAGLVASACDGGLTSPRPDSGIRFTSGDGATDTISATSTRALVIHVTDADGKPVRRSPVIFEGVTLGSEWKPSMWVSPAGAASFEYAVRDTTDDRGNASVQVKFGDVAGEGRIKVTAPEPGFQNLAVFTIRPGAPARTRIDPRDTVVNIDGSAVFRATVRDRNGNLRPETATLTGTDAVAITGNVVRALRFGTHPVRATYPGTVADSTGIMAIPRGRIAAAASYLSGTLVMMDLDGSNRVEVNLGGSLYGLTWAPDGRVIAGVANSGVRLQAVTSTGQISRFLTDSPLASEVYPVFSADGKTLFFAGRAPTAAGNSLWRANPDGTGVRQASTMYIDLGGGMSYGPSPDGTKLVYFSGVHDLATGARSNLWETRLWSWSWSPRGDLVAFNDADFVGVMNPDGTGRRILSRGYSSSQDLTIDWSGDGKYLIRRTLTGPFEIFEPETGARALLPATADLYIAALK